jgi:hypothetical protein
MIFELDKDCWITTRRDVIDDAWMRSPPERLFDLFGIVLPNQVYGGCHAVLDKKVMRAVQRAKNVKRTKSDLIDKLDERRARSSNNKTSVMCRKFRQMWD